MAVHTIGSRLDETGGLGPGFDFLRVALAIGVVLWHQPQIMFGSAHARSGIMIMMGASILPMFFALSGFLIAGSALRLSLGQFLVNRALRIFPALGVEVLLSALVLGPIFTTLSPGGYFTNVDTYRYLTNIVGLINFTLPGVFTSNPNATVNWSIWTVPCEMACYAVMSFMIATKIINRGARIIGFAILISPILYAVHVIVPAQAIPGIAKPTIGYLAGPALALLIPFLLGVLCHAYRYKIPFHWGLAVAASCPVACLLLVQNPVTSPPLYIFLQLGLTYLSAFIGVSRIPPLPLFRNGDYSYGIYLYGAPLQQAVRAALPNLQNGPAYLGIALASIIAFAMLSWHGVEKPVLGLRKRFSFVARARGVGCAGESRVHAPPPVVSPTTGQVLTYGNPLEMEPLPLTR
jgi:peptidoglycan/LPS O-acetylase OafA/YrhL